jgi:hypothetical protein
VDVLVDELNLKDLGFEGAEPEVIGRPAYHPGTLLKIGSARAGLQDDCGLLRRLR